MDGWMDGGREGGREGEREREIIMNGGWFGGCGHCPGHKHSLPE